MEMRRPSTADVTPWTIESATAGSGEPEPLSQSAVTRVASVPAGHVYIRHLGLSDDGRCTLLADPEPSTQGIPGAWWPPVMLDPAWIDRHHPEFDVFHLHFGFDALTPDELRRVVSALRQAGKPLVYTVHDLRNPHHVDPGPHDAALDVLIPHADALITLTRGAADQIARRWGRYARVIPHPHVVDLNGIRPRVTNAGPFVVGVHAKSVRASMNPLAVLRALIPLRTELPELRLQFDVHDDVFAPHGRRHDPELAGFVSAAAESGAIDVEVHDYFTDAELWSYLASLDLSVLPYRFGTHSGWLEACYDLGTAVLAPTCGFYSHQRPCLTYRHDEGGLDPHSLQDAVRDAYRTRPLWQAGRVERSGERDAIAAAHHAVYASVLS